jgi:hypothetical protein
LYTLSSPQSPTAAAVAALTVNQLAVARHRIRLATLLCAYAGC